MNENRKHIETCLRDLAKQNRGLLLSKDVVTEAADESSPLHSWFEWDEGTAAHEYRLIQAGRLIRSFHYVTKDASITLAVPRYVRDPKEKSGYRSVGDLKKSKQRALEAMRAEVRRTWTHVERARGIAAALGLAGEVDAVIATLEALEAAVEKAA